MRFLLKERKKFSKERSTLYSIAILGIGVAYTCQISGGHKGGLFHYKSLEQSEKLN